MLVGAKLATAPVGNRPSVREMLLYIACPPVLAMMAFGGLNELGGGPEQRYVAPVLATKATGDHKKDYVIVTLDHEGRHEDYAIQTGVPPSTQKKWRDFGGLRAGGCVERRWRTGALEMPVDEGWKPVPCPAAHGESPPEGPALVEVNGAGVWKWAWYPAEEGANFPAWRRKLHRIVSQESDRLTGMEIGLTARMEPDGTITEARVPNSDVPSDVASRLADSLIGTSDVLERPQTDAPYSGPLWVRVPVNVHVVEPSGPDLG